MYEFYIFSREFDQLFAIFDQFITEKKPNLGMNDFESFSSQNNDDKKVYLHP